MFEHPRARLGRAFGLSLAAHAAALVLVLLILRHSPATDDQAPDRTPPPAGIVWLTQPGPGGGGGGGGNRNPEPPRQAQLPGRDRLTVPVATPPARPTRPASEPPPVQLTVPAVTTAAGVEQLPGVLTAISSPSASLGPGTGSGAGTGRGTGIGAGDGSGLDAGSGGGTGGHAFEPGNGVTTPRLIYETKPNYTPEAMHAKVQGAVWLEAIVMPDGSVGQIQITRSLDPRFGLDQEALRTVRQWRFAPGLRGGKPVPVRIGVEMAFTLR